MGFDPSCVVPLEVLIVSSMDLNIRKTDHFAPTVEKLEVPEWDRTHELSGLQVQMRPRWQVDS